MNMDRDMDTFTTAYDSKIRPIMDKIDKVRSILSGGIDGVSFPTVVVVGDQSSGKSTLLESLSLVELPKGAGIVTRCPLVLRLRKCSERRVYRLHGDDQKTLLDENELNILQYIEEETRKLAGTSKNVVKDLIELQVEDPNVRDLTVVDLPGIARNPIADQPKDIHSQTTNLIRHFIRQEGSVILCVFPANVDVATVESFTLAREVDPSGIRTIGVITKSDLAPSDDALCQQLLMEKMDVLQLKLGFVAARNRTADEKMSLKDARKREKEFFRGHAASSVVGWHCLGIDALINRLADLYADRVKETFPKMRAEVLTKMVVIREQLIKFPQDLDTPLARLAKYHELADFYVENILRVRFSSSDNQVSAVNALHCKFTKVEKIVSKLTQQLRTTKYRSKVRSAMSACSGEQLPNFLPHPLLKRLVDEKIDQFWHATSILIKECFYATSKLLLNSGNDPYKDDLLLMKLLPAFRDIVVSYLNDRKQAIYDQLHGLIRLEKQEPYTLNHYYMDRINQRKKRNEKNANGLTTIPPSLNVNDVSVSNEEQAVEEMILSVRSYWAVIRKRFMDYAAMAIRSGCVFDVCAGIREQLRCVPAEQCDFVDTYLGEDAHVRAKRQKLQQTHDQLEKVLAILGGQKVAGTISTVITELQKPMENGLDALVKSFEPEEEAQCTASEESDSDG